MDIHKKDKTLDTYKKELGKMLTSNFQEKGKVLCHKKWHKKKQISDLLGPQ